MNQKPRRDKKSSMENEVILAVVTLYLFIALTMLAVHHLQPEGQETVTSSTSPAHLHFAIPRQTQPPPSKSPPTTP